MTQSRALLAGATLSLVGFIALAALAAPNDSFDLDRTVRGMVQMLRHDSLHPAMEAVSVLGAGSGLIPLIALGSAVLWRSRRRWAVGLPAFMAGTGALQLLTKWAIDRPRPNELPWGFPSGHVLSVVVFFGIVIYLVYLSCPARSRRCLASAMCAGVVLAVAASRLYLEAHWLSDVVGGFLVGLAYLLLCIWFLDRRRPVAALAQGPPAA